MKVKKPRVQLPPDSLNSKLLGKMSDSAMPPTRMPTLHLSGKHAKKFHGLKPGSKVSAHVRGTVQNIGVDPYSNNDPTASLQLTHIAPRSSASSGAQPELPTNSPAPIQGMVRKK